MLRRQTFKRVGATPSALGYSRIYGHVVVSQSSMQFSKRLVSSKSSTVKTGQWMNLIRTIEKVLCRPTQRLSGRPQLERALVSCATNGLYEEGSILVVSAVHNAHYELSPRAYAAALHCHVKTEGPQAINTVLSHVGRTDDSVQAHFVDRILMHLLEFKGFETALQLTYHATEELGLEIENDVHSHVATVCAREGTSHNFLKPVVESLKSRNITPTADIYNALLRDADSTFTWETVEQTLDEMEKFNVKPTSDTLKYITSLAQRFSMIERFKEIRDNFYNQGVVTDSSSSSILLSFWIDNEEWDRAANDGMDALNRTFNNATMEKSGNVDPTMFDNLLYAMIRKGDTEQAIQLWTRIMHMEHVTRHLSTGLFEGLIKLFAGKEMWSAVVEVHSIMLQKKRNASDETVETVTYACKLISDFDHMQRMIFYQIAEGLSVSKELANSFLSSAASLVPEQLQRLVRMLLKRRVQFDLHLVFDGLLEQGSTEAAFTVFQSLSELKMESRLDLDSAQLIQVGILTLHNAAASGYHSVVKRVFQTIVHLSPSISGDELVKVIKLAEKTGCFQEALRFVIKCREGKLTTDMIGSLGAHLETALTNYIDSSENEGFYSILPVGVPPEGEESLQLWEQINEECLDIAAADLLKFIQYNIFLGRPWTAFRMLASIPTPGSFETPADVDRDLLNLKRNDEQRTHDGSLSEELVQNVVDALSPIGKHAEKLSDMILQNFWKCAPWNSIINGIEENSVVSGVFPCNAFESPPVPYFPVVDASEFDAGLLLSLFASKLERKAPSKDIAMRDVWSLSMGAVKEIAEMKGVDLVDYRSTISKSKSFQVPLHSPNGTPRGAVTVNKHSDLRTISKMPEIDGQNLFKTNATRNGKSDDFSLHKRDLKQKSLEHSGKIPFMKAYSRNQDKNIKNTLWGDRIFGFETDVIVENFIRQWRGRWSTRLSTLPLLFPQYSSEDYAAHLLWNVARLHLPLSSVACDNLYEECYFYKNIQLNVFLLSIMQKRDLDFYNKRMYSKALDVCVEQQIPEFVGWILGKMVQRYESPSLMQLDNITRIDSAEGDLSAVKKAAEILLSRR